MSYNPIERKLARLLSAFPGLKSKIKYSYQWLNRLSNKPKEPFVSSFTIHEIKPRSGESFWGYYDHSPLNLSNKYVLFHETQNLSQKPPQRSSFVDVVVRVFANQKEVFRTKSMAYNWQQGSKAIWLDNDRFVFNDAKNKELISRLIDTSKSFSEEIFPFPIYDCKDDWGVTLNFDRLTAFRPDYGYRSADNTIDISKFDDKNDGVFLIDLKSKTKKLIVDLEKLTQKSHAKFTSHQNWVNHLMISPQEKRLMFLHRWIDGGLKKDALYIVDKNGENLQCLLNEGMVSHCFWKDENTIVGYMRTQKEGDHYYQINIQDHQIQRIYLDSNRMGDGHPSVFGNQMIFDTYPDRSGMKHLYLFDIEKKKQIELGRFYEPLKYYEESRCDLHPRFSKNGKKVFFDSVHTGKRRLYYIDLEEEQ